MKYRVNINGIPVEAYYHDEDVKGIFQPLLNTLAEMQRKKGMRLIAMIAAPPGAGKSTFVSFLEGMAREVLPQDIRVQSVGMDGFHQRQEYLLTHTLYVDGREVPMVDVKGAPETFDLKRLCAFVERAACGEICGWPGYDRHLHNPVEDAVTIDCDILLIEGNYLLLEENGWDALSDYADYTIFLQADEEMLRQRLVDRKEASGNPREKAEEFVDFSDMRNVRLCMKRSKKADLTLRISSEGRFARLETG